MLRQHRDFPIPFLRTLCVGLLVVPLLLPSSAHAGPAKDFDKDCDGMLSKEEFSIFYKSLDVISAIEFDANTDGGLSGEEVAAMNAALAAQLQQARQAADAYRRAQLETSQGGQARCPDSEQKLWGILVRASHTDVDLQDLAGSSASANGATFSVTEDLASDSSVVAIKGALLRPVRFEAESPYWLLPGIELNRLTNETSPEREIDSVTLRVGSDFQLTPKWLDSGSLHLRLNPLLTTNFGFDVDVRALEGQFEPYVDALGLGGENHLGPMAYRLRALMQLEYGEVFDAGKRTDLSEGDAFSRLGVKLSMKLRPRNVAWLEGLEGALGYERFENLGGDLRARQLLTASLAYRLPRLQNISFETKYTRGDTSVALEDEESWTLGLGIKL